MIEFPHKILKQEKKIALIIEEKNPELKKAVEEDIIEEKMSPPLNQNRDIQPLNQIIQAQPNLQTIPIGPAQLFNQNWNPLILLRDYFALERENRDLRRKNEQLTSKNEQLMRNQIDETPTMTIVKHQVEMKVQKWKYTKEIQSLKTQFRKDLAGIELKNFDFEILQLEVNRANEKIEKLEGYLRNERDELQKNNEIILEKNTKIEEKTEKIEDLQHDIMDKSEEIKQKDKINKKIESNLKQKNIVLKQQKDELLKKREVIKQISKDLKQKNEQLKQKDQELEEKSQIIFNKNEEIDQKSKELQHKDKNIKQITKELDNKIQKLTKVTLALKQKESEYFQKCQELKKMADDKDIEIEAKKDIYFKQYCEVSRAKKELEIKHNNLVYENYEIMEKLEEVEKSRKSILNDKLSEFVDLKMQIQTLEYLNTGLQKQAQREKEEKRTNSNTYPCYRILFCLLFKLFDNHFGEFDFRVLQEKCSQMNIEFADSSEQKKYMDILDGFIANFLNQKNLI